VRSVATWVGLADPGETRLLLQEQSDLAAENMTVLLAGWEQLDPQRRGLTAAEVIDLLYRNPPENAPPFYADMRAALDMLLPRPESRALGNRLRACRRRLFENRFIDHAGEEKRAVRWAVYPAEAFRQTSGQCRPLQPANNLDNATEGYGREESQFDHKSERAVDPHSFCDLGSADETASGNGEKWSEWF